MRKIEQWFTIHMPVWVMVAWDMKWYILLFLILLFFVLSLFLSLVHILSHPELIGQYVGRLVEGFNDATE